MTTVRKIFAKTVYDGFSDEPLQDQLVSIENGLIVKIETVKRSTNTKGLFTAEILAPGFIDLQINGAGDVMFNDSPSLETLEKMARAARAGGTAHLLPTFTTDRNREFSTALSATLNAVKLGLPGILGVHLEGPFLSPQKPGIHPASCIRRIDEYDLRILLGTAPGSKLITLAPEEDKIGAIKQLTEAGWTVFAGHSNATLAEMKISRDNGLSGATHLFNAMSQITVREPGLVGFVLNTPQIFAGIIVDGFHVHQGNVQMAYDLMGPDRLFVVTDAMQTLGGKSTGFDMAGNSITLREGRLIDKHGTLSGAHLAMDQAVQNLVFSMGIPVENAIKMASTTPAAVLGLDHELGQIRPGFRASLTILDQSLSSLDVLVDGLLFQHSFK